LIVSIRVLYFSLYGETDVLYQAHVNNLQKRQKFSGCGRRRRASPGHQQGAALAAVPREHIDPDRFLDFVSTRSPVFKERPLPAWRIRT
jgi:hypothetical protein